MPSDSTKKTSYSPYDTYTAACPYCGTPGCEADWADIGVGLVQCGPFYCHICGASQVGPYDVNILDADERRTGWFKPGHFGTSANTVQGLSVDHKTAKRLYEMGLLDDPAVKKKQAEAQAAQVKPLFGGSGITEELFNYIRRLLPLPSTILELGSGDVSTQFLGRFYEMISVEDKVEWIGKHNSQYIYAPLVNGWYDVTVLSRELPIVYDLLLVDGPTGEGNRGGLLDHLDLFNQNVPFIFDDTNRAGELFLAQSVASILQREIKWFDTFAVVKPKT